MTIIDRAAIALARVHDNFCVPSHWLISNDVMAQLQSRIPATHHVNRDETLFDIPVFREHRAAGVLALYDMDGNRYDAP